VPRSIRASVFLWLSVALNACSISSTRKVTPWFELRDQHPTIDVPHAFASGPHVVSSWMYADGHWTEVQHQDEDGITSHRRAWRLDGGETVLYDDGKNLRVYRRTGRPLAPGSLPCRNYQVKVSEDGMLASCVECRFPHPHESRCWGSDTTVFRSDASVVAHYSSDLPAQMDGSGPMWIFGLGFLSDGRPLVLAEYATREPLNSRCMLIAVSAGGAQVLADVPIMQDCEKPESWKSRLPDGVRINLQMPTWSPHAHD
jgi:hypothetical protein